MVAVIASSLRLPSICLGCSGWHFGYWGVRRSARIWVSFPARPTHHIEEVGLDWPWLLHPMAPGSGQLDKLTYSRPMDSDFNARVAAAPQPLGRPRRLPGPRRARGRRSGWRAKVSG